LVKHLIRTTFFSLIQLKSYIDDPNDSEINWRKPFCELQYPIEIDWENLNLNSQNPSIKQVFYTFNPNIDSVSSLNTIIGEGFKKSKDIALFRVLTEDIAFIIKDKSAKILLTPELSEWLQKETTKEEYYNTIEELSTKKLYFPLSEIAKSIWDEFKQAGIQKEDIQQHLTEQQYIDKFTSYILNYDTEKERDTPEKPYSESKDYFYFSISRLTINLDEKKAYYPITVGVVLPSFTQHPSFTKKDMDEILDGLTKGLKNFLEDFDKQEKYPERAFTTLKIENDTFAIPSNPLMFTLLAMFAGRPERIPRKLLDKAHKERTPKEKEEADKFINSIFDKQTTASYDSKGNLIEENKIIAVISDSPKVEAKTEIATTLFGDDLNFKEESLAIYIQRTFGAEGLRHLLAILIGLDDAGRTGEFVWSVNEHLDRLGYKKMQNGSYAYELKQTALEIVRIFTSLFITATNKNAKGTGKIAGRRLFHIEGFEKEYKENWVVDEKLTVKASDYWYKNSFESSDSSSQQFTKLLKDITRENHREHALTIYLAPLLAVFWRINSEVRELSIKNLMDWCDIPFNKRYREALRNIETELDYMKQRGYLGNWENKTTNLRPSDCNAPLNCVLSFYPPDWLQEEFKSISFKKEMYLDAKQKKKKEEKTPSLTVEEFKRILQNSKLSNRQFANKIGVSPALITRFLNGERAITQAISLKIKSAFESVDKI